jgi:hypothetical protein
MVISGFALLASVTLLAALVGFGARRPEYSHLRHTISELGEVGAADSRLVSLGVFLPMGLLFGGAALVAAYRRPESPLAEGVFFLALCLAVGYGVAALFPCDPGSPLQGSWRQGLHNLGGGVEYVGGAAALYAISRAIAASDPLASVLFQGGSLLVLFSALALSVAALPWRGAVQRVAELVLFGALVFAGRLLAGSA